MHKTRTKLFSVAGLLFFPLLVQAATEVAPITEIGQFELPPWFKASFLDLKEDVTDAASQGKRLALFFHQEGCPYCAELINNNFGQKPIVNYTRKHFDVLEINMWGDREVTDFSGKSLPEKEFAASQKVWFTPTLLFFNEQGEVVLRLNGYYPPHQFLAALKYVAQRKERSATFREYYAKLSPPAAVGKLHEEPFFEGPPYDLTKRRSRKPLAVFFEQKDCAACDELHGSIFNQAATLDQIRRFQMFQLDRWSDTPVVTPEGKQTTAWKWANELNITYVPSAVLFDEEGKEVIRIESMVRAFHIQSIMDYVASGAYKQEPSLQRFISARADQLREQGLSVDLWK